MVPNLAWSQAEEESHPKVVVLVDSGEESLQQRLRQEMESLGLEVAEITLTGNGAEFSLEAQAKRLGAIAAVRISATDGGTVEMTIIDRATGKTVRRSLLSASSADPAAIELIAIRTIELLRASLLEVMLPHPSRGDVPVTAKIHSLAYVPSKTSSSSVVPKVATKPEDNWVSRIVLSAGPVLVVARSWSTGFDLGLGATAVLFGPTVLEGAVQFPLISMEHEATEGRASLNGNQFRIGTRYCRRYRVFEGGLSAGVTMAALRFAGHAKAPYVVETSNVMTYGGYVGVSLGIRLSQRLRVRLEQTGAYLVPRTVVRFAGNQETSFGPPVANTVLALEWGIP
jgi:hypothetical protein